MEINNNDNKKLNIIKESLEDITLYLSEVERLSFDIISSELKGDDDRLAYLTYKLKILECYIEDLNKMLKDNMKQNDTNKKFLS
ncbi:MAG: hypothetical protein LDL13_04560 [Calditerrivibrio sp.]|nr:hypothetical protein [Calditerrivibrio sp.]MCA1932828.1 hypothetical protein [Calditerrivibrio sp.]